MYFERVKFQAFSSVQFSSVTQSCLTLCNPMNCSTPGLPVHHQLLEFTQTHVHRVGDAIQPSHPLSAPSPPAQRLTTIRDTIYKINTALEVTFKKTALWVSEDKEGAMICVSLGRRRRSAGPVGGTRPLFLRKRGE